MQPPVPRRAWRRLALAALCVWLAAPLALAQPQLTTVQPRGLSLGGTVTLQLTGQGLDASSRLVLDNGAVNLATEAVRNIAPPAGQRWECEVTLPSDFAPGIYPLRVQTDAGISPPLWIGVDALPQLTYAADLKLSELPAAVSGTLGGDQVHSVRRAGQAGETLQVEVEARRLGSKLNPVVRLYNDKKIQLAWSAPQARLGGDARLAFKLPATGEYIVELHDANFRGADPGFYRLKVGSWVGADFVFPLASQTDRPLLLGLRGLFAPAEIGEPTLLGRVAPGQSTGNKRLPWLNGVNKLMQTAKVTRLWSGDLPEYLVSDDPQHTEPDGNSASSQSLSSPLGMSGVLFKPGEEDRFQVAVTPGKKLKIELRAARLGSPLDGVLTVYDETGKNQLAGGDDQPNQPDSMVEFTPAENQKIVTVGVKDLLERGGPEFYYHLAVAPADRPDFQLSIAEDRVSLPAGGGALIRVTAQRQGYNGPISLQIAPREGTTDFQPVKLSGQTIPAGQSMALFFLSSEVDTPPRISALDIIGLAEIEGKQIARAATRPLDDATRTRPWYAREVLLNPVPASPLALSWEGETPELPLGQKVELKLNLTRTAHADRPVRITLVTNQPQVKKTIKENNQDKQVDDVERMIRLSEPLAIPANQAAATVTLAVPGELPLSEYDVTVLGEILGPDDKQVIGTALAPILNVRPTRPVKLELTKREPNAPLQIRAGLGETAAVTGRIIRAGKVPHALRVTVDGWPKGLPVPTVDVPADAAEFLLPLRLPFGFAPDGLKTLHARAFVLNPAQLGAPLQTNRAEFAVSVVAGEKPAVEPPLVLFDDQEDFAALFKEGNGQATIVKGQQFSGESALRVTPDQKFGSDIPVLGIKIRREPGPGEYRFIRFAWKKQGGKQICLQFNHDNQWGPAEPGKPPFRYHAGEGDCFKASLLITDKIPSDYTVVTRDLFADFGEFTLTGMAFSPIDGEFAFFDQILLGRTQADLDALPGK